MQELHSVIDKDGFAHVVDENGQYYEPTIKTIRTEIDPIYRFDINDFIEKQQLIKFLEDKIKETDKFRKMHKLYSVSEERLTAKYYTLIEVLDFVRGGKDE